MDPLVYLVLCYFTNLSNATALCFIEVLAHTGAGILAMVILGVVCVPLQEVPLKKWVLKQEGDAFAFSDPKYLYSFSIVSAQRPTITMSRFDFAISLIILVCMIISSVATDCRTAGIEKDRLKTSGVFCQSPCSRFFSM